MVNDSFNIDPILIQKEMEEGGLFLGFCWKCTKLVIVAVPAPKFVSPVIEYHFLC